MEELLRSVTGLYTAAKLLGAGGGGHVLFLSDSVQAARNLRERLSSAGGVHGKGRRRGRVVGMSLNLEGLQVTVS